MKLVHSLTSFASAKPLFLKTQCFSLRHFPTKYETLSLAAESRLLFAMTVQTTPARCRDSKSVEQVVRQRVLPWLPSQNILSGVQRPTQLIGRVHVPPRPPSDRRQTQTRGFHRMPFQRQDTYTMRHSNSFTTMKLKHP